MVLAYRHEGAIESAAGWNVTRWSHRHPCRRNGMACHYSAAHPRHGDDARRSPDAVTSPAAAVQTGSGVRNGASSLPRMITQPKQSCVSRRRRP